MKYSRQQIEEAFDQTLNSQRYTLDKMRGSMPTARDTQQALNNLVTFIGCGLKDDLLSGFKEAMFKSLDHQNIPKQAKDAKLHSTLTKMGVQQ